MNIVQPCQNFSSISLRHMYTGNGITMNLLVDKQQLQSKVG
jgi:hypothetical protein